MTLEVCCETLQRQGHVQMTLHEDHVCGEEDPHYLEDCPLAPHFAFSEAEVAGLDGERDLDRLLATKLQRDAARAR